MNTSLLIARRLAFNEKKSFSRFIIRIAIVAVALSVAVMIIGSAITRGYQHVIQNKFYDCWGQIHITSFLADPSNINNEELIDYNPRLVRNVESIPGVQSISAYSIQSSILKTPTNIEGILLKGIRFDNYSINPYLIKGSSISFKDSNYSNQLIVSSTTASALNLQVGSSLLLYFLNKNELTPKARKVLIKGIYKTGLEEYDKSFAICDSRLIANINNRSANLINGYEIHTEGTKAKQIETYIFEHLISAPLETNLIEKRFANVFSWLNMMQMNERIIIIIMLLIAVVNMITALLILILERTPMIGLLKAIGMQNTNIRKIFLYSSTYIMFLGIFFGTVLGIGICFLQSHFGFIHLDEQTYYVKTVPIFLDPKIILGIDAISVFIAFLLLLIPTYIIKTISPTKAIQFN